MKLAILFWFYKELDLCESRLVLLRLLNPRLEIFGLYGGPSDGAAEAERRLGKHLDDFYAYQGAENAAWRWRNGDRLIAAWHGERGRSLSWDTIIVAQWDALFLRPVRSLFRTLKPGEALFSGLRPESEVEQWWPWMMRKRVNFRADAQAFRARLRKQYGYRQELWCCQFIVACLPRRFLDLYVASGPPKEGFLEYKLPTMARLFGIPLCMQHPFRPWWPTEPSTREAPAQQRMLNAIGECVSLDTVLAEIAGGRSRVVHPYRHPFPMWLALRPIAWLCILVPSLARFMRLVPEPAFAPPTARVISA